VFVHLESGLDFKLIPDRGYGKGRECARENRELPPLMRFVGALLPR
jgi:hypothetical protein